MVWSFSRDVVCFGFWDVVVKFAWGSSPSNRNNSISKFLVVKFLFLILTSSSNFSVGSHIQDVSSDCEGSTISSISSSSSDAVSSQNSYAETSDNSDNNNVKNITFLFPMFFYGL